MSLNYKLREGQTNGDLQDMGINDDILFSFLLSMNLVGVPTLKDSDHAIYAERMAQYLSIKDGQLEQLATYRDLAFKLKGIHTNVSRKTKTQWKTTLYQTITDNAERMLRETDNANH